MFRPFVRFRHYKVICLSFFFFMRQLLNEFCFKFFFRLTFLFSRSETIQSRQLVGVCLCPSTCADISCHMFARLTFMTCGRYEFILFYFFSFFSISFHSIPFNSDSPDCFLNLSAFLPCIILIYSLISPNRCM